MNGIKGLALGSNKPRGGGGGGGFRKGGGQVICEPREKKVAGDAQAPKSSLFISAAV
jgi:hypothetical protein